MKPESATTSVPGLVFVQGLALVLILGLFGLPAPGFAQACRQTLDMTPMGGQRIVQCHEVTEMPQSTINALCRPAGNPQARTVPEQLDKCPSSYAGRCATPLRVIQANLRRLQGLPPETDTQVPETATITAYFYDGMPPNAAEQCSRSGGTWTAGKTAPVRK